MNIGKKIIFLCIFLFYIENSEITLATPLEIMPENQAEIVSENAVDVWEDSLGSALEDIPPENGLSDNVLSDNVLLDNILVDNALPGDGLSDNGLESVSQDVLSDNGMDEPEETDAVSAAVSANAEENALDGEEEQKDFEFYGFWNVEENGHWVMCLDDYYNPSVDFFLQNNTNAVLKGTVTSTNEKVVAISSGSRSFTLAPQEMDMFSIHFSAKKIGIADITVEIKGEKHSFRVHVTPGAVKITDLVQTAYQTLKLSWEKSAGCNGYYIERAPAGSYNYSVIKTVNDKNITSVSVTAPWGEKYAYRVVGFTTDGGKNYRGMEGDEKVYTADRMGAPITSVKKSGASSLKITWKKLDAATGYVLYRAQKENGNYKKVYTARKGTVTSYTQKVSKGVTYYYKLVTMTKAGNSRGSAVVAQFIPKPSKQKAKKVKMPQRYGENLYYYESGGRLYIVRRSENLKIYAVTSDMQIKFQKTVKLGKYDRWGGFYQGTDGKFYVAIGYNNYKESKTKTVIKVIQYSGNWKKQKIALIKGNVENEFQGIYEPFAAGACRMDMQGDALYVHTCRTMFALADGLHHQSNISFAIDTKTMKVRTSNDSYVSHSFDQYVRFKDGSLYLLDHGDAFPRTIFLTTVDNFGTENVRENGYATFQFMGKTGDNFTGCVIGGMEVGGQNVLVTGISMPHKYKVKGVTGFKSSYEYNLFLTVTNRQTGKNTVKWLTRNNPKTTKIRLNTAKMLKLSDDRFVILCSQTKGRRSSVQYIVVDGNGKKVYAKSYANLNLAGENQPFLLNGKIFWLEDGTLYRIPAVY